MESRINDGNLEQQRLVLPFPKIPLLTMTWKADLSNGVTGTNTVRVVGSDRIEWRVVASNNTGKVFVDLEGTYKRQK
jgi:hypothetical protein